MLKMFGLVAVTWALAMPAYADPVIDQNAPPFGSNLGAIGEIYQEFHPGYDNVAGGGIYIDGFQSPTTLTISLYDANDVSAATHVATGPALASGTVTVASGWDDVFWNPVSVVPGGNYFLNFEVAGGFSSFVTFGPSPKQDLALYMYGFDYSNYATIGFRTFSEPQATPVPGALVLLGSGLAVWGGLRRKTKT